MQSCGLELVAVEPEVYQPCSEGEFRVAGDCLLAACAALCFCLVADREAQLDVCFDLACVGRAVEASELDRSFLPHAVQVERVVAAAVVVLSWRRSCPLYQIVLSCVMLFSPRVLILSRKQASTFLHQRSDLLASRLERCEEQGFLACHDVCEVPEAACVVCACPDVDVDAAAGVDPHSRVPQLPYELLYRLDVAVPADWADQFAPVVVVCAGAVPFLGADARVAHDLPYPSAVVRYLVGAVGAAGVFLGGAQVLCDCLCCIVACHACEFDFDAEGLFSHVHDLCLLVLRACCRLQ